MVPFLGGVLRFLRSGSGFVGVVAEAPEVVSEEAVLQVVSELVVELMLLSFQIGFMLGGPR